MTDGAGRTVPNYAASQSPVPKSPDVFGNPSALGQFPDKAQGGFRNQFSAMRLGLVFVSVESKWPRVDLVSFPAPNMEIRVFGS